MQKRYHLGFLYNLRITSQSIFDFIITCQQFLVQLNTTFVMSFFRVTHHFSPFQNEELSNTKTKNEEQIIASFEENENNMEIFKKKWDNGVVYNTALHTLPHVIIAGYFAYVTYNYIAITSN